MSADVVAKVGQGAGVDVSGIAGGLLYLRDQDDLLCYDLRKDRTPLPAPASRLVPAPLATRPGEASATRPAARPPATAPDAIFVPTPQDVVEMMLELAAVRKEDVVYDLGCGRIVATAARKYGCWAAGFDTDPEWIKLSRQNVQSQKVGALVEITRKDVFTLDLIGASVVTLYMGRDVNRRLVPQLQKLKPGSRVVSHAFDIEGYEPDKAVEFVSSEDDTKHVLYLWTAPLHGKP